MHEIMKDFDRNIQDEKLSELFLIVCFDFSVFTVWLPF